MIGAITLIRYLAYALADTYFLSYFINRYEIKTNNITSYVFDG